MRTTHMHEEKILKARLAINGMTQRDVACHFSVSAPYINMIIRGKRFNKQITEYILDLPYIGAGYDNFQQRL